MARCSEAGVTSVWLGIKPLESRRGYTRNTSTDKQQAMHQSELHLEGGFEDSEVNDLGRRYEITRTLWR